MQQLIELYKQYRGSKPTTVEQLPGAGSNRAYFRLADGSRCVAYKNGEYWTADRVDSDMAAKNYFMERTGADYTFIILDD